MKQKNRAVIPILRSIFMSMLIASAVGVVGASPGTASDPAKEDQGDRAAYLETFLSCMGELDSGVLLHSRAPFFGETNIDQLNQIVAQFNQRGLRLRIGMVDAAPTFSLGDFTNDAWSHLGCTSKDVLIMATRSGVHGKTAWLDYIEIRSFARQANAVFANNPTKGLEKLSQLIIQSANRIRLRRMAMGGIALASALMMGIVVHNAIRRKRKRKRH